MQEKVVLFGGIGRLGIPVAEKLVSKGWKLAISYRTGRGSEKTVRRLIEQLGEDKVLGIDASISNEQEANNFIDQAFSKYGRIDALINIASHYPEEKFWKLWESGEKPKEEDWAFYESNFIPIRNTSLAVIRKFKENPSEELSIINFSDSYTLRYVHDNIADPYFDNTGKNVSLIKLEDIKHLGFKQLIESGAPQRDQNPYTLSKRDITYLTKRLAIDNQGGKIRVNAIAPGPMLPPPDMTEKESQPFVDVTLLKKWGYTDPIVQGIDFLLNASFVTGHILKVDGGADLYHVAKTQKLFN